MRVYENIYVFQVYAHLYPILEKLPINTIVTFVFRGPGRCQGRQLWLSNVDSSVPFLKLWIYVIFIIIKNIKIHKTPNNVLWEHIQIKQSIPNTIEWLSMLGEGEWERRKRFKENIFIKNPNSVHLDYFECVSRGWVGRGIWSWQMVTEMY